jgi:hypothetical protein
LRRRALQVAVAGKGQGLALPGQPLRIGLRGARIGLAIRFGGLVETLHHEVSAAQHGPAFRVVGLLLQFFRQLLHHGNDLLALRRPGGELPLRLPAAAQAVPAAGEDQQQDRRQQHGGPAPPAAAARRRLFRLRLA